MNKYFICLSLISFVGFACTPQNFYMKEKVIGASAPPAIHMDQFVYGKPSGPVDILFVLDNTESSEALADDFKKAYQKFTERFQKSDQTEYLDYRVQVVTTPKATMVKNYFDRENPLEQNLENLNSVFDQPERGFLKPFESTLAALTHPSEAGRVFSPLFLVYVLGDGTDPSSHLSDKSSEISSKLDEFRGLYQTHVVVISRKTLFQPEPSIRYCDMFFPPFDFHLTIDSISWKSRQDVDLCSPSWGSFEEKLWDSILDFKTKFVLSRVPSRPETMVVRKTPLAHKYRYGDDFIFNHETNEVVFQVQEFKVGDQIEVSYFLSPASEEFSGKPTPPALPDIQAP